MANNTGYDLDKEIRRYRTAKKQLSRVREAIVTFYSSHDEKQLEDPSLSDKEVKAKKEKWTNKYVSLIQKEERLSRRLPFLESNAKYVIYKQAFPYILHIVRRFRGEEFTKELAKRINQVCLYECDFSLEFIRQKWDWFYKITTREGDISIIVGTKHTKPVKKSIISGNKIRVLHPDNFMLMNGESYYVDKVKLRLAEMDNLECQIKYQQEKLDELIYKYNALTVGDMPRYSDIINFF